MLPDELRAGNARRAANGDTVVGAAILLYGHENVGQRTERTYQYSIGFAFDDKKS